MATENLEPRFVRLVGIDPGVHMSGYAVFDDGVFVDAGVVRSDAKHLIDAAREMGSELYKATGVAGEVVCEHMFYYPHDPKSQPNDLIAVEFAGGILVQSVAHPKARTWLVTPRKWKGTIPKDIHNARTIKRCPEAGEHLAKVLCPGMHNHALDAVGLALWRLDKIRTKD